MGCWLDCEAASLERWGRAALTAAANAFLQRVEAAADRNGARYRGGVYCNRNWARNFLDLKDPAGLARFRFWYARPVQASAPPADTGRQADLWQFAVSDRLRGMVNGQVDCNFAYFRP